MSDPRIPNDPRDPLKPHDPLAPHGARETQAPYRSGASSGMPGWAWAAIAGVVLLLGVMFLWPSGTTQQADVKTTPPAATTPATPPAAVPPAQQTPPATTPPVQKPAQ